MLKNNKTYNSKILLVGEYTVMTNGNAIAIPYDKFGGQFEFEQGRLSTELFNLYDYLHDQQLENYVDMVSFRSDLEMGIYFHSNIPYGYGLGSSGALVAALYSRYGKQKTEDINKLRTIFGKLESAFHGTSSGMDPLVSFLGQPVLFSENHLEIIHSKSLNLTGFFLLDTGISRSTSHFVELYRNKKEYIPEYNNTIKELELINKQLIQVVLKGNRASITDYMEKLSQMQYKMFTEMIPENFRDIWLQGLESGRFYLKLCGAGGGGMLLGWSPDTIQNISSEHLQVYSLG